MHGFVTRFLGNTINVCREYEGEGRYKSITVRFQCYLNLHYCRRTSNRRSFWSCFLGELKLFYPLVVRTLVEMVCNHINILAGPGESICLN